MNIVIFDTETTSLEKPFCYNIGYTIRNLETGHELISHDFVVEQVWHNTMLFTTAYYADKREIYIGRLRNHSAIMDKFGYICQTMIREFKAYNVQFAFAYNSPFDEKVFNYNCDWFKCCNPFDNIPIYDIRGYAHHFIVDNAYKVWCEEHKEFTETGNYSTTAETMFRYLSYDNDFVEEHTALADSEIEWEILNVCITKGAEIDGNYEPFMSIKREEPKDLIVKQNGEIVFKAQYDNIRFIKSKSTIYIS